MHGLTLILIGICVVTVVIDCLLLLFWFTNQCKYTLQPDYFPKVSILVAARNEDHNITRCIEALIHLKYPKENLEILIGDDQSEDDTYLKAKHLSDQYPHIRILSITDDLGKARGKANVLAHLARAATGEILFITDADIAVNENWIQGMLRGLKPGVGIVNGVTAVEDNAFQNIDWLFAMGMIKVITDLGQSVTAIGNNMCITREAHDSVGGYESIPFSITEDFELFRQVKFQGFGLVQLFDSDVFAKSNCTRGLINLLHQRKRWMFGAVQLPWNVVSLLFFQASFYVAVIVLLFINMQLGLTILLAKVIIQSLFITVLNKRLKQPVDLTGLLFYEFYAFGLSLLSSIFFLVPSKIKWKGRKY